jgi:hypothetical protein
MEKEYDEFIVYDLKNTGEKVKLDVSQEELQDFLNSEQVLIIVREDLRRIYIWKGSKSPVRKRFISSRIAQDLQKELMTDPKYHRCKIVSIDQGEELHEFLHAFKLESMEVTERLPDMKYIRNYERDQMKNIKEIEDMRKTEIEYYSPITDDDSDDIVISSIGLQGTRKEAPQLLKIVKQQNQNSFKLSQEEINEIKEKVLANDIPVGYERQNLILGHSLYGIISKTSKVFGRNVVEVIWEEVKKYPQSLIELNHHKLRVYLNESRKIVEAVEVLKKKEQVEINTQSQTVLSNDGVNKSREMLRKGLPKIPKSETKD